MGAAVGVGKPRTCRRCRRRFLPTGRGCSTRCKRCRESGKLCDPVGDPSPDEIREACLAIQASWSEAERIERMRCDRRPVLVEIHPYQTGVRVREPKVSDMIR